MRHDTEIALIERMLAYVDAGSTQLSDEESVLSVARYTSPDRLAGEMRVLRRFPLALGRASQIPCAGDYYTHDATGVPILVVRAPDGAARAFLNVCRHRGTRLVNDERGAGAKAFTCRYHAWSYDLCGSLLHIPQKAAFPRSECDRPGLVALPVVERHGFLWVTPSPDAPADNLVAGLGSWLGLIDEDLDGFALGAHHLHRRVVSRRRCNWKLVIEAFLEGYHVRSLHRDSIYRFFLEAGTVFDAFGPHVRSAGARRAIKEARTAPKESWSVRTYATVFYYLFPNTILVMHPDWISHITMLPDGPDASVYTHDMLIPSPPTSDAERAHWDKTFSLIEESVFQKEDLAIAESIQTTLRSGANEHFRIGRLEHPIKLFHDALDEAIAR